MLVFRTWFDALIPAAHPVQAVVRRVLHGLGLGQVTWPPPPVTGLSASGDTSAQAYLCFLHTRVHGDIVRISAIGSDHGGREVTTRVTITSSIRGVQFAWIWIDRYAPGPTAPRDDVPGLVDALLAAWRCCDGDSPLTPLPLPETEHDQMRALLRDPERFAHTHPVVVFTSGQPQGDADRFRALAGRACLLSTPTPRVSPALLPLAHDKRYRVMSAVAWENPKARESLVNGVERHTLVHYPRMASIDRATESHLRLHDAPSDVAAEFLPKVALPVAAVPQVASLAASRTHAEADAVVRQRLALPAGNAARPLQLTAHHEPLARPVPPVQPERSEKLAHPAVPQQPGPPAVPVPGVRQHQSVPVDALRAPGPTLVAPPARADSTRSMREAIDSALQFATTVPKSAPGEAPVTNAPVGAPDRDIHPPDILTAEPSSTDAHAQDASEAAAERDAGAAASGPATPSTLPRVAPSTLSAYDRWNRAIADVFYPTTNGPKPIFLDLEESRCAQIAEELEVSSDDVEEALSRAVAEHLDHSAPNIFEWFDTYLDQWMAVSKSADGEPGPPPVLALLAVFSLAAEHMSRDTRISAQNYYERLLHQLHLQEPDKQRLEKSFRDSSERLWHSLGMWLEANYGQRGIPTAQPVGPRYVGLPISQALLRDTDREALPSLFAYAGLTPHQKLLPEDLELQVDSWVESGDAPHRIERLWQRGGVPRDALLSTATALLASWDGTLPAASHPTSVPHRHAPSEAPLLALEPPDAFNDLALTLLVRSGRVLHESRASINEAEDELYVDQLAGDLYSVGDPDSFDPASLLQTRLTVTLRPADGDPVQLPARTPKSIVVFQADEDENLLPEVSAVRLGVPAYVLASGEAAQAVATMLERVAAPGWERTDPERDGVPAEWTLFQNVRVMRVSAGIASSDPALGRYRYELQALIPPRTGTIQLVGGLRVLKGRTCPAYISTRPPGFVVSSDNSSGYAVVLEDLDLYDPGPPVTLAQVRDPLPHTVRFPAEDPTPTRYRLRIVDRETTETVRDLASLRFDLVAPEDSPRERQQQAPLLYTPHDSLGMISASPGDSAAMGISGASVGYDLKPRAIATPAPDPIKAPWAHVLPQYHRAARIVVPTATGTSCFNTGAHKFEIETPPYNKHGYPVNCWVKGHCKICGLERCFPSNTTMEKRLQALRDRESAIDIAPVAKPDAADSGHAPSLTWDDVFEGLMYLDSGSWEEFRFIASQGPSGRFGPYDLARSLMSLGLLDTQLAPATMTPERWHIPGASLVPVAWLDDDSPQLFLAGAWSGEDMDLLEDVSGEQTYTWPLEGVAACPEPTFVHDTTKVREAAEEQGYTICQDWHAMAGVLPTLSEILANLPQCPPDVHGQRLDLFDPETLEWVETEHPSLRGAYRISDWSRRYLVRTGDDIQHGTARRATSALAKHVAAWIRHRDPLLAWDQASGMLYVPLGAELPGLYSRAAALASGLPPQIQRINGRRCLTYSHVPYALAAHLRDLLSS